MQYSVGLRNITCPIKLRKATSFPGESEISRPSPAWTLLAKVTCAHEPRYPSGSEGYHGHDIAQYL